MQVDESIYCSTLDSLEPDSDLTSPSGRLVLDYEDTRDWPSLGLEEADPVWVWLSLGSYSLDSVPNNWLAENNKSIGSVISLEEEPWRRSLLNQLQTNSRETEGERWAEYQPAIQTSSWVKTSLVKVNTGGSKSRWEQCVLELEQCGTKEGQVDFGTLSMFGQKSATKEHLSLAEITCVSVCSEKTSPQLAVYTPARSGKLQPILIKFGSEAELFDWHGDLVASANSVHGTTARPGSLSVYSVTGRGEVMVWDSKAAIIAGEEQREEGSSHSVQIPVEDKPMPLAEKLINGFSAGSALYTEIRIAENCGDFALNLQCGKIGKPGDVALHFNPRLEAGHVVLNTFDSKTETWGAEEMQPLVVMSDGGGAVRAFIQVSVLCYHDYHIFNIYMLPGSDSAASDQGRGQQV